jgi:hypothetical protein
LRLRELGQFTDFGLSYGGCAQRGIPAVLNDFQSILEMETG